MRYHEEIHPGQHTGIIDPEIWQRVQSVLGRNGKSGGALVKNKYGALLKGILRCAPCNCSMGHTYTADKTKRYRYYVCLKATKRGWHTCPSKSVPAGDIERFVIEQIKAIGKDPEVLAQTVQQAKSQGKSTLVELQVEERTLQKELKRHHASLGKVIAVAGKADEIVLTESRIRAVEIKITEVRGRIVALGREIVDEREVESALSVFDPVWDTLCPREQARIIRLLVERVDYDGGKGTIAVTFHANGIKTLAAQCKEAA